VADDWTFGGTWPYEPRWLSVDGVRIHYVDEGSRNGQPVVLLHGNPTWSYLYRRFVDGLVAAGYRAVAFDQLGFGRSDKPASVGAYSVPRSIGHFSALADELALDGVTLVGHDWGAMIALAWALEQPGRVRRLVVYNSFTGSHPPWPVPLQLRMLYAPGVGAVMTRGLRATVRMFLFRGGTVHAERLGRDERRAYLAPHPTWASRAGLRAAVRMIPWNERSETPRVGASIDEGLARLGDKPALVAWGMRDTVVHPGWLENYRQRLPQAEVHELDDAGHFLQEDAHERLVPLLLDFLDRTG
jgi:pimeloyl-ACP methyl ester carboxylesterase